MKTKTILIAAVMFFALSVAAFAQTATFQVGSIPVTAVANSGQTEKTGSITFSQVSGTTPTPVGTITVNYGVPITNCAVGTTGCTITVAAQGIQVAGANIVSVNNTTGQITISVPSAQTAAVIQLSNVRVATAGTTLTTLSASVSTVGVALLAGQTSVVVINSIAPGIAGVLIPAAGLGASPAKVNAVTAAVTQGIINVREGFINAYGLTSGTDTTQTGSTMVRLTLSQAPPAGVSITFPVTANATDPSTIPAPPAPQYGNTTVANAFQLADATGAFLTTAAVIDSTSTNLTVYYRVATDTDVTRIEDLTLAGCPSAIPCVEVKVDPLAAKPLPATDINMTATLAPIGNAFGDLNAILASPIPRYAAQEVGPTLFLSIVSGSTTLIVPFASTFASFDTGLAIANTTTDPGRSVMGLRGAVKQAGLIKFYFYPQSGTATIAPYTTKAGSPGAGLSADGTLATGRTYSVLLSELLAAAGATGEFNGYIVAVCLFTNAHGQYFVTDFESFTSGSQTLVVPGDRSTTPEVAGQ
jgi:hypothetical protein